MHEPTASAGRAVESPGEVESAGGSGPRTGVVKSVARDARDRLRADASMSSRLRQAVSGRLGPWLVDVNVDV
ncbi:hypothetical protein GCM10011519_08740 [Marmoricola endophyticus]|uniref:Uncharacterized protein n=1 Tax=Marmoricola endophyticus TaxID=2040280 RepID=A0A917EZN5_9ACTN|nr:hypothetical protein GCM10011519_08740 [Marmoricola endophyticus]